jgi:hypothetical protein
MSSRSSSRWHRVGLGAGGADLLVVLLLLVLPAAVAATPQEKFRSGNEVVIPADETVPHDLYVSGGTLRVDGRIDGDLIMAGGQVDLTGTVTGDVRVAGGTITVRGPVGEDLLVGGGRLLVASSGQVGEDLIFSTGQTMLEGTVAGSVLGTTGTYARPGSVAGNEHVTVQQPPTEPGPTVLDRVLAELRRYLSIVLFGLLFLGLAPRAAQAAAAWVRVRPLPSFGVGILAVLAFLVALGALVLIMVILGLVFGLLGFGQLVVTTLVGGLLSGSVLTFVFFLLGAFLTHAVVGLTIGRLLVARVGRAQTGSRALLFGALLLGVLIVVLVTALPVIGGLLNALVVLLGMGALILMIERWRRTPRAEPA